MFEDLPPFLTVEQAAKVLQLGRSKTYQLSAEWERTGGVSGLPFVWFGHQKRIPRAALERFVVRSLAPPAARPGRGAAMLRISKLTDAGYVLEEVAGGLEDYYLGKGDAPGVWAGALAARFGLEGVVGADELRALIDRLDPNTGAELAERAKPARVRAFDATFSAPKSVSLLHALAEPETASVVGIAHVDAVQAALRFLETKAAVARQQAGGVRRRAATSGCVAATFVHRTSREGDPQFHTHVVIPNLCAVPTAPGWRWTARRCTAGPRPPGRCTRSSCDAT